MDNAFGTSESHEVAIVGAGVAGLALAGALSSDGIAAPVLERARGVGGRCATRRIDGIPVDFGAPYVHGRGDEFVAALEEVRAATGGAIDGWPLRRQGEGIPCRTAAFEPGETRVAWAAGVTRFPKHLARGLDVRLGSRVTALRSAPGQLVVECAGAAPLVERSAPLVERSSSLAARTLVLAMAPHQMLRLIDTLPAEPAVGRAALLVRTIIEHVTLTVIARYAVATPAPDWDAALPAGTRALQSAYCESSKRPGTPVTIVLHGRPRFSRERQDEDPAAWSRALLDDAAEAFGGWAAQPVLTQPHRWRGARVAAPSELAAPLIVRLACGATLALCGDGFDAVGGVEGAWRSGVRLAADLSGTRRESALRI